MAGPKQRKLPVEITPETRKKLHAALFALGHEGYHVWGFVFRSIPAGEDMGDFVTMETFNNGSRTPDELKQDTLDFLGGLEDPRIKDSVKHSPVAYSTHGEAFVMAPPADPQKTN